MDLTNPDDSEAFRAEMAQHQRNYDALVPTEFEALLADGARADHASKCLPPHWSSPSAEAWTMGYGMHQLAPYGRRRFAVAMLLHQIGFILDNPQPRQSIRLSMELLCIWSRRTEPTTRRYLAILHESDILMTNPNDTYSRGLWFPYPAIDGFDFREDHRYQL